MAVASPPTAVAHAAAVISARCGLRICIDLASTSGCLSWTSGAGLAVPLAVAGGGDVRLHCVLRAVRRVAGGHHAFVEGAGGAVAVVAADAEDDGALLAHRVVARDVGAHTVVEGRQAAGLGVATADGPVVRLPFDNGGGVPEVDGRIVGVQPLVHTGEQAVLHVGHDPGAVA